MILTRSNLQLEFVYNSKNRRRPAGSLAATAWGVHVCNYPNILVYVLLADYEQLCRGSPV